MERPSTTVIFLTKFDNKKETPIFVKKYENMKLTIEVSSQTELEKIIVFFQTLKLDSIRVINDTLMPKPKKRHGNYRKTSKNSGGRITKAVSWQKSTPHESHR